MPIEKKRLSSQIQSTVNRLALPKKREQTNANQLSENNPTTTDIISSCTENQQNLLGENSTTTMHNSLSTQQNKKVIF
jgi:hypothetical protein